MDLRNLWRRRLEVLIANLREGEQEHREIASLAEHIGADYHSRFLVELLQNASDSAADASLEGAKVIVVRTSELVAIANQGLPFNEKGVRSITSLGMSPKDPRFFIGNKGIGFKAVFEVTDSPEIFSAGASDGAFVDDNALRLRLHTHPFDQPRMAEELRNLVTEVLDHHRDFFEIMAQRGEKDPVGYVLEEARHAAPFKFPLPVGKDELDARLRVLGGFNGEKLQTLIVLPLLQGPRTQGVVDEAIKDLLSRGGATLLFLPSVVQIIIQDRVQNRSIRVSRSQPGYLDEPTKRDQSFFVKTSVVTFPENVQAESEEIPWIVVRRRIGGNEAEAETSDQVRIERERIRETASALPGDTWKKVDFAEVSVALSLPEPGKPGSGLPIPDGRICIGLPTKDRTGTPFWVDARFHGTISRKEIDLTLEYNHILFGEAVGLARELVERLKAHPELPTRRAVTLAMEVDAGPLAEEFRRSGGVLHAEVVLSPDGMSFVKASSLALMRQDDAHIVERSRAAGIDVEQYGFHLAEAGLLRNFRPLLDRLIELTGGQPPPVSGDARFLQSISHGQSLIETLASHYRTAGDSFWGPFMDWVVSRFPLDRLLDQHILPIGDSDLAQPSSHVFYRPAPRSDTAAGGGEEVDIIPDQVRLLLRFLDERQIRIRGEDGRTLTPLARRLSPEVGTGLVESPRKESLLNEALIPRLKEVTSSSGDDATAILLLELAARWTETKDARKGPRIRFEELLVPTLSDGKWIWHPPDNVYGGSGWQAGKDGELMDAAYGAIPKRRLVPWKDFAARGRYSDDFVGWWRDAMVRFGVLTTPKIVRTIPPQAPLEALANQSMAPVKGIRCPLAQATEFWESYLAEVSRQTVLSKKGRRYTVRELLWIEGLEWGVSRAAVVELILRHPEVFEPVLETSRRTGRRERRLLPGSIHVGPLPEDESMEDCPYRRWIHGALQLLVVGA